MITEIKGSDLTLEANMMYRCKDCGNLFEEGEQAVWEETHGLDSPPYEKFSGCPVCKGDYEEVHQCKECGDWHTDDELYDGWCEKCLRDTINYDTFLEYCEANKDEQYLDTVNAPMITKINVMVSILASCIFNLLFPCCDYNIPRLQELVNNQLSKILKKL